MTAIAAPPPPTPAAPPQLSPHDLLGMEAAGLFELAEDRLLEERLS